MKIKKANKNDTQEFKLPGFPEVNLTIRTSYTNSERLTIMNLLDKPLEAATVACLTFLKAWSGVVNEETNEEIHLKMKGPIIDHKFLDEIIPQMMSDFVLDTFLEQKSLSEEDLKN